MNPNKITSFLHQKFVCINCDFKCCKKGDFNRHLLTYKHKILKNPNEITSNYIKRTYTCDCGKLYKHASSLCSHKNNCIYIKESSEYNPIITTELIMELINDNKDMKSIIMEQNNTITTLVKNGITNNSHNITNSNNKTFNLQFFLNETCKNAMNIMDFVDSIKLELTDLVNVGKLGYVEGISNIITTNLKALDITQRPIHCADKKREVIYVKDENKWEKEDEEKRKIKKAIHRVACKNQRLIPKFKEEHPDCLKASSNFSDQYNKIIVESMGGSGDNDKEKEEKIIRNISKNVIIEKE